MFPSLNIGKQMWSLLILERDFLLSSEIAREWGEKIRNGANFSVCGANFIEVERILEELG